jgi:hypothetical protein
VRAGAVAFAVLSLWSCGGSSSTGTGVAVADGRHFGYIRTATADSVAVDFADFLTGAAANAAARAAGDIGPTEQVPNDYYIANPDPATVMLPVAAGVRVTRVACPSSCREGLADTYASLLASYGKPTLSDTPPRGPTSQYWLTTRNGEVVRIDEQYLP